MRTTNMNRALLGMAAASLVWVAPAAGQTDYYNTDSGRPVRVEDAYPVERHAFEGQVAPLRIERIDAGAYHWEFEPELAYGIFPSTQLEFGLHLDSTDQSEAGRKFGLEALELALLHNLNVETNTWPAFAIAAQGVIPLGYGESDWIYPSIKGIATRTFRIMRIHLNGEYTSGSTPKAAEEVPDVSRWMAGVAIDRAFPLRGALLIADLFVEEPMGVSPDLEWTLEMGARYQLDPFFALDIGVGRRLTGDDLAWFATLGAARTFGFRSLMSSR
jgi:hypothetical protein